jgi:hypothetical protein
LSLLLLQLLLCTCMFAPACLHLPVCTCLFAPACLHLPVCGWVAVTLLLLLLQPLPLYLLT